jgi:hypothetical protein
MGLLDKAKKLVGKHEEQIDSAIDKAEDLAEKKLGDKHGDKIEKAADKAHEIVDKLADDDAKS